MDRHKRRVWRWVIAGVVALALLLILGRLRPAAPRKLDLLTGSEGSSYHRLGERYAEVLKNRGVRARVVVTRGALDNLERLARSDAPAVAFAETGVEKELDDPAAAALLVSLGSLAYEPIWLFARKDRSVRSLSDLAGAKVALGPRGSGTRALARLLLDVNGLTDRVDSKPFDDLTPTAIDAALSSGSLDAAFLVANPRAPRIRDLLTNDMLHPVAFERAEAYAARNPELARLVIPMGAIDLALNLPAEDLELVAGATNLVAREDLHASAVGVILGAARVVQSRAEFTAVASRFPSMDHTSLPLSETAVQYFQEGPSGLARMLPYWAAAIADQLIFVVLPALLGLLTVLKFVPTALNLRFSYQSTKLYRRLTAIEKRTGEAGTKDELLAELARIDAESQALKPTLSKLAPYFEMRQNLHDVRDRVEDSELG